MQSLAVNLIVHSKTKTTLAKAKEVRPYIERLITYAKRGGISSFRATRRLIPSAAAERLIKEIVPRYQERKGGYTRIIKIPRRKGDAAALAFIELV